MSAGQTVRGAVIGVPVAGLVGAASWVIGVDEPHAIAIGVGALAVIVLLLAQRSGAPAPELLPPDPQPSVGGRRDVEQLAWSMVEQRTRIRGVVLTRVAAIAAHRLRDHDLDLQRADDAAAIETLLGPAAWAVLRPDRERPVSPRALDAALRAIDHLPPPDRTRRAD